jgi:H+-transporting ATPase
LWLEVSAAAEIPKRLTGTAARRRMQEPGPNVVEDEAPPRWRPYLAKFWAPIPSMLEAAIIVQMGSGNSSKPL